MKETFYKTIFEMASDAIILVDAETLTIIEANPAVSVLLGHHRQELIGQNISRIDSTPATELKKRHQHILSQGSTCFESRLRHKNGQLIATQVCSQVMPFNDQHYFVSIYRDIRDYLQQKQALMASEEKFRYFIEHNTSIMLLIDPVRGSIEDANQAACDFYGYSHQQLVGMNIDQINTLPQEQIRKLRKQAIETPGGVGFIVPHRLSTGEIRQVEVHTTPLEYQGRQQLFSIIYDITERYRTEQALRENEENFYRLFDLASNPIILLDPETGTVIDCNRATLHTLGYRIKQEIVGKSPNLFLSPYKSDGSPALPHIYSNIQQALEEGTAFFDCQPVTRDGRRLDVEISLTSLVYRGKKIIHALWTDISMRKKTEQQLKLAASVFDNANEAISIIDPHGNIIDVNQAFLDMSGFSLEEIKGEPIRILHSGKHDQKFYSQIWQSLLKNGRWKGEIWNRRKDGQLFAGLLNISALYDKQGQIDYFVSLMTDITILKNEQEKLRFLAYHDSLTHLPNRILLHDRLELAMAQSLRHKQYLAVVFLDVDAFKDINDQYGHETGDQLLISITRRLKALLRSTDTLARIGGDEFVLVIPELKRPADCEPLLEQCLVTVTLPVDHNHVRLTVSASMGVSFYPQQGVTAADQLLRQADLAMYQAKLAGKNQYVFFDPEQDRSTRIKHRSIQDIKTALARNELTLYYQPKVNMATGQILGAEALLRWIHPEKGMIAPGQFLHFIENTSLSIKLDQWVIESALAQMSQWQKQGLVLPLSINLSAYQLQQKTFPAVLQKLLSKYPDVPAENLTLEILESSAMEDIERVVDIMELCRHNLGVRFSLDDFGTGYSSLTYLKRLRVEQLKIDQSFVRNALYDVDDQSILQSIMGLAGAFHCEVIAEGIETQQHGLQLLQFGCPLAQGYAIAKPMPANQIPGWIGHWQPHPDWTAFDPDISPGRLASTEKQLNN